jgi:hypothetical protein
MEENTALAQRATKQIQLAARMTADVNQFTMAVGRSAKKAPKRPTWERHVDKDAESHRKVQARLRELLGTLHDK